MRETGLGLKAATVTPETTGDVGSPNRILREGVGGSVIVRTGRRIPGVAPPASVVHPIVVVRMAVGDAYGAEEHRTGDPGSSGEQAWRTERIDRSVCRSVAEFSFRTASQQDACVYGGPKWTVSTVYEGMLKEEMDAAAARYPEVPYRPTLIDAAYAGLLTESSGSPLVIPALNRDGDCLSDLVLALFGSIAGAESVLLALDDDLHPVVAMAEAPHGTAPSLMGKNVANPMAMLLACAAVLDHAAHGDDTVAGAAAAIRRATLDAAADGVRTFDLGGEASTSEVVDEVLVRLRTDQAPDRVAVSRNTGFGGSGQRESSRANAQPGQGAGVPEGVPRGPFWSATRCPMFIRDLPRSTARPVRRLHVGDTLANKRDSTVLRAAASGSFPRTTRRGETAGAQRRGSRPPQAFHRLCGLPVQGRPRGAKRSPSLSIRRSTSAVSKRRIRGSFLAAHRVTSAEVTGVETVGVDIARTEYTATVVLAEWF